MTLELIEYSKCQFELSKQQKDGSTLKDHLMMAYKASGIMPQQLADAPNLPELAAHVWEYFLQLHIERGSSGMSHRAITSTGIKDWCEISRIKLEPWELRAIRAIDNEWMRSENDN